MQKIVDGFNSEVNNIKENVEFLEDNIISNIVFMRNINEIFDNLSSLKSNNDNEIRLINNILITSKLGKLPQWFKAI